MWKSELEKVKLTTQHYEGRQPFFKSSNVYFEKDLKLSQDLIAGEMALHKKNSAVLESV